MHPRWTLLPHTDYPRSKWKNGGGITSEIAIHPPDASVSDRFVWRASIARIEESGPFSSFPDYDRVILLLDGDGMALDFGDHGGARVERPFVTARFKGEWTTHCKLLGGPVHDFNVMFDRALIRCEPRVLSIGEGLVSCEIRGATALLLALRGHVTASLMHAATPMAPVEVGTWDTLRIDDSPPGATLSITGKRPDAVACFIDLESR